VSADDVEACIRDIKAALGKLESAVGATAARAILGHLAGGPIEFKPTAATEAAPRPNTGRPPGRTPRMIAVEEEIIAKAKTGELSLVEAMKITGASYSHTRNVLAAMIATERLVRTGAGRYAAPGTPVSANIWRSPESMAIDDAIVEIARKEGFVQAGRLMINGFTFTRDTAAQRLYRMVAQGRLEQVDRGRFTIPGAEPGGGLRSKVLTRLRVEKRPVSERYLLEATGATTEDLAVVLGKLRNDGLVLRPQHDQYVIATSPAAFPATIKGALEEAEPEPPAPEPKQATLPGVPAPPVVTRPESIATRVFDYLRAHGGRASLAEMREAGVYNGTNPDPIMGLNGIVSSLVIRRAVVREGGGIISMPAAPAIERAQDLQTRVLALGAKGGTLTTASVMEALGATKAQSINALYGLHRTGKLERVAPGAFRVPTAAKPPARSKKR
jgi:hypothetical protein